MRNARYLAGRTFRGRNFSVLDLSASVTQNDLIGTQGPICAELGLHKTAKVGILGLHRADLHRWLGKYGRPQ